MTRHRATCDDYAIANDPKKEDDAQNVMGSFVFMMTIFASKVIIAVIAKIIIVRARITIL